MAEYLRKFPDLSAHGRAVLHAINMAIEKMGLPVKGFFNHNVASVDVKNLLEPYHAHKRRNFLRALNGSNRFMEIGFNAGYSALLALDSNPGASYICIDAGENPLTKICGAIIQAAFPGRCHLMFGTSQEILDNIARTGELGSIDVIHVNGARDARAAQADVLYALSLIRPAGIVLVGDLRAPFVRFAVDDALRKGLCTVEDFQGSWEGDESIAIRAKKGVADRPPLSVVYSAVGQHHVLEAAISAWSAKRWMPNVLTVLVSDQIVRSPHFDRTVVAPPCDKDPSRAAKIGKVHAIRCAETEQVLYVDSDTYFVADVRSVFDDRTSFDIAATYDTWQYPEIYRKINSGMPYSDPPDSQPFFNSGVIFLNRSAKVDAFLDKWIDPFINNKDIKLEQMCFREAIYSTNLSVRVLPSTFNARIGEPNLFSGSIKIAHRRLGSLHQWNASVPFITEFLNQYKFNRLWVPNEGKMHFMDMDFRQGWVTLSEFSAAEDQKRFLAPDICISRP